MTVSDKTLRIKRAGKKNEKKKGFKMEVNDHTRLASSAHLLLKCLFQIPVL